MATVLGMDGVLYRGVAGTTATTAMSNVKDVTLALEIGEADVTTRGSGGWELTETTLLKGSVSFKMLWDTEDTDFSAIQTAFFNRTALAFFVTDGSGTGLDADFKVLSFSRDEALTEAMSVDVTIKPTRSTRAPEWVEGS